MLQGGCRFEIRLYRVRLCYSYSMDGRDKLSTNPPVSPDGPQPRLQDEARQARRYFGSPSLYLVDKRSTRQGNDYCLLSPRAHITQPSRAMDRSKSGREAVSRSRLSQPSSCRPLIPEIGFPNLNIWRRFQLAAVPPPLATATGRHDSSCRVQHTASIGFINLRNKLMVAPSSTADSIKAQLGSARPSPRTVEKQKWQQSKGRG
ncbi:uncharacterized protein TRIVIDRAFT_201952 [Trichoderma virens Gv29-8]|uniref:Uncharacterized protein n=1 Tax=Hypocrea virens (strain Gv29-8 / FGSC 10586) TaxID=413071 RepID=G9MVP2_HYPVG|nr:uncharacterized protein TRIVIDRAFT_201952 [Trichoderma virens Gv29-8]EHK21539.1 hypothetical protein TRIVIDRAFT_201952 [Trichoderma virens Gv29-8]UKZ53422.1 hypothetical protein TrVGV298_007214 [Trichoderma virens]